jgi:hypothetical protein
MLRHRCLVQILNSIRKEKPRMKSTTKIITRKRLIEVMGSGRAELQLIPVATRSSKVRAMANARLPAAAVRHPS